MSKSGTALILGLISLSAVRCWLPCVPSIWKMNCFGPRVSSALANSCGLQSVRSAWKLSWTRWNGPSSSVGKVISPTSR